ALITEVCDNTEVAELKLKVGGFEMHLKRKIEAPIVHAPVVSALPSLPPSASKLTVPASPMKSSSEKISPFTNIDVEKSEKLAALEATGANGFILVSSPSVGSFRRARTLKGKKQPPACKEGDVIKVGQTVGFLVQFGTELAVKSDAAGEVLKLFFNDDVVDHKVMSPGTGHYGFDIISFQNNGAFIFHILEDKEVSQGTPWANFSREEREVCMRTEKKNRADDCTDYEENGESKSDGHDLQLTCTREMISVGTLKPVKQKRNDKVGVQVDRWL
ncbi:hypothetical protein HAX54_023053, partial [Datura stramonium]|nr:hypothetical protein [Datura stramonium]